MAKFGKTAKDLIKYLKNKKCVINGDTGLKNFKNTVKNNANSKVIDVHNIGDSITLGSHAGENNASWIVNGYSPLLNTDFANRYELVGQFIHSEFGVLGDYWTYTGTWTSDSNYGFVSQNHKTTVQNSTASIQFTGTGVDVFLHKRSGFGGIAEIYVDDVLKATINCNGTTAPYVERITGLEYGTHTLLIKKSDATAYPIYVLGMCSTKGNHGVRVNTMGISGITMAYGAGVGITSQFDSILWPNLELTTIAFGVNDYKLQTNIDTFRTQLQNIITAAKARGDVLLIWPSIRDPSTVTGGSTYSQKDYVDVYDELAKSNNVAFLNMYKMLGSSFAAAQATGLLYDTVHLNSAGHSYLEKIIFKLLTT